MRRAQFMELDIFVAILILISSVLLIKANFIDTYESPQVSQYASDISVVLNTRTVGSLDDAFLTSLNTSIIADGFTPLDRNLTIARQAAILKVEGGDTHAQSLVTQAIGTLLPHEFDVSVALRDENGVHNIIDAPSDKDVAAFTSRTLMTGFSVGEDIEGFGGVLFLNTDKDSHSAIAYFGGFVGQGNLSVKLVLPPNTVVVSGSPWVTDLSIEGGFADNFTLYVNGFDCGEFVEIVGDDPINDITSVDLTQYHGNCYRSHMFVGENTFDIIFEHPDLEGQYVSGGFIRAIVSTQGNTPVVNSGKFYLPGVTGLFNVYDSFYVPGRLDTIEVHLDYFANHSGENENNTVFFTLGNLTIWHDNKTTTPQTLVFDNQNLTAQGFRHSLYPNATIPYRFGFSNLSTAVVPLPVDAVLITDVSGSMDKHMGDDNYGGIYRPCDHILFNEWDTARISVANCTDKMFVNTILDNGPHQVGLIAYSDVTHDEWTVPFTNNRPTLIDQIEHYDTREDTCICCGIVSAQEMILEEETVQIMPFADDDWYYYTALAPPADDPMGHNWTEEGYNEPSPWVADGQAVFGTGLGLSTVPHATILPRGDIYFGDFWENESDRLTNIVEFNYGPNSTGNTPGWNGVNDGWDWAGGTIPGYPRPYDFFLFENGNMFINMIDDLTDEDMSGFFGITVNITDEMFNILTSGGDASFYVDYDNFESGGTNNDYFWMKVFVTNPSGDELYLGQDLDAGPWDDPTNEIVYYGPGSWWTMRPGTVNADITSFITSPGYYYFTFAVKFQRNFREDFVNAVFDNVSLTIQNNDERTYYFRKTFTVDDLDEYYSLYANVLSDNNFTMYVNGRSVYSSEIREEEFLDRTMGTYWDKENIIIPRDFLHDGENIVAVVLNNSRYEAAFDMEIRAVTNEKAKAILVMSDGAANHVCPTVISGHEHQAENIEARFDAIQAACDLRELTGAFIFSVGFSVVADVPTLQGIASCDDPSHFYMSSDPDALITIYNEIADVILSSASYEAQIISFDTSMVSELHNSSFIEYEYTPYLEPVDPGKIIISGQSTPFAAGCVDVPMDFPAGVEPVSASVASYSGSFWTNHLTINGVSIFDLDLYNSNYTELGDPFMVGVPRGYVQESNTLTLSYGDGDTSPDCSPESKFLYSVAVDSTFSVDEVYPESEGCNWLVDGILEIIKIPSDYAGSAVCRYSATHVGSSFANYLVSTPVWSDDWTANDDVWAQLGKKLFESLDLNPPGGDGIVDIDFEASALEYDVAQQSGIPYLWGPAILEVTVWQ